MALYYTPPSLPRTPSSCNMNASLPSLSSELLATWSSWRMPKHHLPLTPPTSRTDHQSLPMSLPPITTFMAPLTPPPSQDWRTSPQRLPSIDDSYLHSRHIGTMVPPSDAPVIRSPSVPADAPHLVDWLDNTLKRPVSFVAEKTCEMICYLWFATSLPSPTGKHASSQHNHSPPYSHQNNPATTALQLVASPNFVSFMQKVLETTQVGQSVIVLSMHYIYRLKERNCLTTAQSGSEFRIAVAALMMANKFLDDNTYTNKTWSDVSGIELEEVSRMEREFLLGIDFNLYVDQETYESWRDLLKGLVMAKERDRQLWHKPARSQHRSSTRPSNVFSAAPASRSYSTRLRTTSHRARSTSPGESRSMTYAFEFTAPPYSSSTSNHTLAPPPIDYSPTPRSGSKRQAMAAFSPTSETFSDTRPTKRPTSMSLEIPASLPGRKSNSVSPLESLQSFSRMSLGSSPNSTYTSQSTNTSPAWMSHSSANAAPQTLVTAYRADKPVDMPQNLYYYSLAGSAMENDESHRRKAKLRCHQPPPPTYTTYYPPQRLMPLNIQSASASPHEVHLNAPTLPHFHDTVWTRPNDSNGCMTHAPQSDNVFRADSRQQQQQQQQQQYYNELSESPIPTAPFANAGPPGFQFYTTPAQQQPPSPLHSFNWPRGRRL